MNMNQKGFANIILVVVIIVVLVGAVGYFAFVKKFEPITQQPTLTQTQITIPAKTSISSTPALKNETMNWKTYSSAQYGFEFKYPSDYSIRTENFNIFVEKQNGGLYAVVIIDNPSKLSASEYFEKFKNDNKRQCEISPCASILSSKVIQINNLQAVEAELAGEGSNDVRSIYFLVGNKIINYQYGRDNLNTEFGGNHTIYNTYISNGDKILSTFKLR